MGSQGLVLREWMLLHLSTCSWLFAPKPFLDNLFGKDWDQNNGLDFFLIMKTGLPQSSLLGSGGSVVHFGFKITQLSSFPEMEYAWV